MNTRFNPTVNGDHRQGILHLGHIAMVLVNEYAAHSTGGKFIVRFDNTQIYWRSYISQYDMDYNCYQIMNELKWLNINVDDYTWQSSYEREIRQVIKRLLPDVKEEFAYWNVPIVPDTTDTQYPYTPYLTAEVALCDSYEYIDTIICGKELLDRFSLYQYMCDRLELKPPTHIFLPRIKTENQNEIAPVSKTEGNFRLKRYRDEGYEPEDIIALLADACLKDTAGPWAIDNLDFSKMTLKGDKGYAVSGLFR